MTLRLTTVAAAIVLLIGANGALGADKPTDPQIAHIAYTAGVLDIEAAKQAIATSKNKAVVEFAESMVRDHEAVNKQALDLVKKLNVTPEDNDTSKALSQAARNEAPGTGEAFRRGVRQGLCRKRGRLSQRGQRRA